MQMIIYLDTEVGFPRQGKYMRGFEANKFKYCHNIKFYQGPIKNTSAEMHNSNSV